MKNFNLTGWVGIVILILSALLVCLWVCGQQRQEGARRRPKTAWTQRVGRLRNTTTRCRAGGRTSTSPFCPGWHLILYPGLEIPSGLSNWSV